MPASSQGSSPLYMYKCPCLCCRFYGESVRAYEILSGAVEPPPECAELYDVLSRHEEMFERAAFAYAKRKAVSEGKKYAERQGLTSSMVIILY